MTDSERNGNLMDQFSSLPPDTRLDSIESPEDLLARFRAVIGGTDQRAFREQVIRAFKHLGLDTVKFFGE